MENWKPIEGFEGYSVSNLGNIRKDSTGRILRQSKNQYGVSCVGMMRNGIQQHRSVPLIVATHFLDREHGPFDTPINLNGDRDDNRADNLTWRPRWFAIQYNRQMRDYLTDVELYNRYNGAGPIRDVRSGRSFSHVMEAAAWYGLLARDIYVATLNHTYVWPTYQTFEFVEN